MTDLETKTDEYERKLAAAIEAADVAAQPDTPMAEGATDCLEMARSYLEDGRHFREDDDDVNALAAFSYGHGWLDAGARLGVLSVPTEGHLFTI